MHSCPAPRVKRTRPQRTPSRPQHSPYAPAGSSTQRKALKIIRLLEGKAILFLGIIDDYVVTGTEDGAVRFYDLRFR